MWMMNSDLVVLSVRWQLDIQEGKPVYVAQDLRGGTGGSLPRKWLTPRECMRSPGDKAIEKQENRTKVGNLW